MSYLDTKIFIFKVLFHPVTQINLLLVGSLIFIQGIHIHSHYTMDTDPESYCYSLYKKNPNLLNRHKYD